MRPLWYSNAPWVGSGYGVQTKLILNALKQLGHDPACFAYYGLEGGRISHNGYEVWPSSAFDEWGNDVIRSHTIQSNAEAVVSLVDLFVLDVDIWSRLPVPWVAWTPIDHEDIGLPTLKRLQVCDVPVAMSDFGAQEMMKAGIEEVVRIYHAVDTDVFKPLDQEECRDEFQVEQDAYVIGMVMANKGDRKQFPVQLKAIKAWMDKNPDYNVKVFLHTDPTAKMGGWDMKSLVEKVGLKGKVYSTGQYFSSVVPLPDTMMAKIYNCFDVLLNASAGEGFGVPIIEAQACGVPVIAGNYTSMPELVHNGYTVEPEARVMGSHFGYQYIPSLDDIVYRLDCVYRMTDAKRRALGEAWVRQNCSVPIIAEQWHLLLTGIQGEASTEDADEPELAEAIHS